MKERNGSESRDGNFEIKKGERPKVAIVRFIKEDGGSVNKAIASIDGLKGIDPFRDSILIKPNLVFIDNFYEYPPYGVLTTATVIEELLMCLKEAGCRNISIGEGSIVNKAAGSTTASIYRRFGFDNLKKRYGAKLIDFNDGPHQRIEIEGLWFEIAEPVLKADFIINVPVLKTHSATKVSLGMKNLKGCLSQRSKRFCHHGGVPLHMFIWELNRIVRPHLNIIDGIYSLERGPHISGRAYRTDLLVASRDTLSADIVGCHILGIDPNVVEHMKGFAQREGRSLDLDALDIVGEALEEIRFPLQWDWEWEEDGMRPPVFRRQGIEGFSFPRMDDTLCTGCSSMYNPALVMVAFGNSGRKFDNYEFLTGKSMKPSKMARKTFLFGNCMIKAHLKDRDVREAIPIKGCPPKLEELIKVLNAHGVNADIEDYLRFRKRIMARYAGSIDFDPSHFLIQ